MQAKIRAWKAEASASQDWACHRKVWVVDDPQGKLLLVVALAVVLAVGSVVVVEVAGSQEAPGRRLGDTSLEGGPLVWWRER